MTSRDQQSEETLPDLQVSIWRGAADGAYVGYTVPQGANQTVLDAVTHVQRDIDPTLSYRFACRVGMCGSCAMTVNGRPRWTCRTHVAKVAAGNALEIGPLRNLPVIKDLTVDMTPFFEKWTDAKGYHTGTSTRDEPIAAIEPGGRQRAAADAGIECINCAVCYAACDVVTWKPDYLGPAALNRAWTLHNDTRDGARLARLTAVAGSAGCHNCHSHQACMEHCPKHLSPTASIAGLKRATALAALKGEI